MKEVHDIDPSTLPLIYLSVSNEDCSFKWNFLLQVKF